MGSRRNRFRVDRLVALAVVAALVPVTALLTGTAQALAPTPVFAPYVTYRSAPPTAWPSATSPATGTTTRSSAPRTGPTPTTSTCSPGPATACSPASRRLDTRSTTAGGGYGRGRPRRRRARPTPSSPPAIRWRSSSSGRDPGPGPVLRRPGRPGGGGGRLRRRRLVGPGRGHWIDTASMTLLLLRGVGDGQFAPAGHRRRRRAVGRRDRRRHRRRPARHRHLRQGCHPRVRPGWATPPSGRPWTTSRDADDRHWCDGVTLGDLDGDGRTDVAFAGGATPRSAGSTSRPAGGRDPRPGCSYPTGGIRTGWWRAT